MGRGREEGVGREEEEKGGDESWMRDGKGMLGSGREMEKGTYSESSCYLKCPLLFHPAGPQGSLGRHGPGRPIGSLKAGTRWLLKTSLQGDSLYAEFSDLVWEEGGDPIVPVHTHTHTHTHTHCYSMILILETSNSHTH